MKRDELFEVLEPPAHGLTRLRARIDERRYLRAGRWLLVSAITAAVLVVLWPRERVDLLTPATALTHQQHAVEALGDTRITPMASTNPRVAVYRAFAAP